MKLYFAAALCLSMTLSMPAGAQEASSSTDAPAQAAELLDKSIDTYRKAPALTDTMFMTIDFPAFTKQSMSFDLMMDQHGGAKITSDSIHIVTADDAVYLLTPGIPKKYVQIDITTDLKSALEQVRIAPPFHFIMRAETRPSFDDVIQSLSASGERGFTVTKVEQTRNEQGDARAVIHMSSLIASMKISVDPETSYIREVHLVQGSEGNPDYGTVTMTFDPKLLDSLPEKIAFDTTGKRRVATMMDLTLGAGDDAPDFTLESSEGETIKLSDLRGSVVVLDFWATWCKPCIMALPKLDEFNQWAKSSGKPIKVFAVNVWEKHSTSEQRKTAALSFWQSGNFSMPTLLDIEGTVAATYGFQSIPTTVIVGPDGTIAELHSGFSQGMVELLKMDVEKALEKSATAPQSGP